MSLQKSHTGSQHHEKNSSFLNGCREERSSSIANSKTVLPLDGCPPSSKFSPYSVPRKISHALYPSCTPPLPSFLSSQGVTEETTNKGKKMEGGDADGRANSRDLIHFHPGRGSENEQEHERWIACKEKPVGSAAPKAFRSSSTASAEKRESEEMDVKADDVMNEIVVHITCEKKEKESRSRSSVSSPEKEEFRHVLGSFPFTPYSTPFLRPSSHAALATHVNEAGSSSSHTRSSSSARTATVSETPVRKNTRAKNSFVDGGAPFTATLTLFSAPPPPSPSSFASLPAEQCDDASPVGSSIANEKKLLHETHDDHLSPSSLLSPPYQGFPGYQEEKKRSIRKRSSRAPLTGSSSHTYSVSRPFASFSRPPSPSLSSAPVLPRCLPSGATPYHSHPHYSSQRKSHVDSSLPRPIRFSLSQPMKHGNQTMLSGTLAPLTDATAPPSHSYSSYPTASNQGREGGNHHPRRSNADAYSLTRPSFSHPTPPEPPRRVPPPTSKKASVSPPHHKTKPMGTDVTTIEDSTHANSFRSSTHFQHYSLHKEQQRPHVAQRPSSPKQRPPSSSSSSTKSAHPPRMPRHTLPGQPLLSSPVQKHHHHPPLPKTGHTPPAVQPPTPPPLKPPEAQALLPATPPQAEKVTGLGASPPEPRKRSGGGGNSSVSLHSARSAVDSSSLTTVDPCSDVSEWRSRRRAAPLQASERISPLKKTKEKKPSEETDEFQKDGLKRSPVEMEASLQLKPEEEERTSAIQQASARIAQMEMTANGTPQSSSNATGNREAVGREEWQIPRPPALPITKNRKLAAIGTSDSSVSEKQSEKSKSRTNDKEADSLSTQGSSSMLLRPHPLSAHSFSPRSVEKGARGELVSFPSTPVRSAENTSLMRSSMKRHREKSQKGGVQDGTGKEIASSFCTPTIVKENSDHFHSLPSNDKIAALSNASNGKFRSFESLPSPSFTPQIPLKDVQQRQPKKNKVDTTKIPHAEETTGRAQGEALTPRTLARRGSQRRRRSSLHRNLPMEEVEVPDGAYQYGNAVKGDRFAFLGPCPRTGVERVFCYNVYGLPRDPAIVLVSGLGSNCRLWPRALCLQLASCGLFVVCFDNRDSGLTTHWEGFTAPSYSKGFFRSLFRHGNDDLPVKLEGANVSAPSTGRASLSPPMSSRGWKEDATDTLSCSDVPLSSFGISEKENVLPSFSPQNLSSPRMTATCNEESRVSVGTEKSRSGNASTTTASRKQKKTSYTLLDMAQDTLDLMSYLKISAAHLLGTSMGGMIVQDVALLSPERVKSLSLLATHCPGCREESPRFKLLLSSLLDAPEGDTMEEIVDYFIRRRKDLIGDYPADTPSAREMFQLSAERSPGNKKASKRQFYAVQVEPSRKKAIQALQKVLSSFSHSPSLPSSAFPSFAASFTSFQNLYSAGMVQNSENAPSPSVFPVAVIHGKKDRMIPISNGYALHRLWSASTMHVFDKLGHNIPDELVTSLVNIIASAAESGEERMEKLRGGKDVCVEQQ